MCAITKTWERTGWNAGIHIEMRYGKNVTIHPFSSPSGIEFYRINQKLMTCLGPAMVVPVGLMMNALIIRSTTGTFKAEHVVWGFELSKPQIYTVLVLKNTIILLLIASSVVASFICQEGQSAKTIPNFSWFSPSFFPIFGKCFTVNRGTLPPLTPSGYATANCTWIGIYY